VVLPKRLDLDQEFSYVYYGWVGLFYFWFAINNTSNTFYSGVAIKANETLTVKVDLHYMLDRNDGSGGR
jgi:hypothetical protein